MYKDLEKMEFFFRRKSAVQINLHLAKIRAQEDILEKVNEKMTRLKNKLENLNTEYFCGKEILCEKETEELRGRTYKLVIRLPNIRMQALVFPNLSDCKKTFVVRILDQKVTISYPEWYLKNYPKNVYDIKTFEEAKFIALTMLKEIIEKGLE